MSARRVSADARGSLWDSKLRLLIVAFSAANINLLPFWRSLIFVDGADAYYLPISAPHDHVAALVSLLVLGLLLFGLLKLLLWLPRLGSWPLFLVLSGLLVNPLVAHASGPTHKSYFLAAAAGVALAFVRFPRPVLSAVFVALLVLSPFAAMNAARALIEMPPKPAPPRALTSPVERGPQNRVVWALFDELDGRFLYGDRRGDWSYPAFDGLAEQSVHLTHAVPVADMTIRALPAYWIGKPVAESFPRDRTRLDLELEGADEPRPFDSFDNLFQTAWARGARIGVVGFHHPYCRLFSGYLSECESFHSVTIRHRRSRGVLDATRQAFASLSPIWRRVVKIRVVEDFREPMLAQVGNPELDLVALHFSMPHMPAIYDASTGRMNATGLGVGYRDNLAKADRMLAEMLARLRETGLDERTQLIVTSDHGLRAIEGAGTEPGATPLLVRMAGSRDEIVVEEPVSTIVMHDLVLDLLSGEIESPTELARMLRTRGTALASRR